MSAFAAVLRPPDVADASAIVRTMIHGGPARSDRTGTWDGGHIGLAHAALFVTPEDVQERQPAANPEGVHIVAADLRLDHREDLLRRLSGYRFSDGPSDTDLVLAAYDRWGDRAPEYLEGDFAFVIWDTARRRLFGARDALGVRPFYFSEAPEAFYAASTAQSILHVSERPHRLNELAAAAFLTAQPLPPSESFYEGIHQLPPAHAIAWESGRHRTWRYWDVDFSNRIRYRTPREYADHFQALLRESVQTRLRTAFPVGILLSGGLDSGAVASFVGESSDVVGQRVHTASFSFPSFPGSDERHVSDRINEAFGFRPHTVDTDRVWPLQGPIGSHLHRDTPLSGAYQPLIDAGVRSLTDAGVRLVLGGHRGDLMAGEDVFDYAGLLWSGRWRRLRDDLETLQSSTGAPGLQTLRQAFSLPLRRSLWPLGRAEGARLWLQRRRGRFPPRPAWVRAEWVQHVGLAERSAGSLRPLPLFRAGTARLQRYRTATLPLHVDVAVWLGRVMAAHGATHADPWSDRRVLEFVVASPQWVLNRPGELKALTREALRGVMPDGARREAGKYNPMPLLDHALRLRERATVEDLTTRSRLAERGYVDAAVLSHKVRAYLRGETDLPLLWWTLALEMWLREFEP